MTQVGVQWNFTRAHPYGFGVRPGLLRLGAAESLDPDSTPSQISTYFNSLLPWKSMVRQTKSGDVMVKVPAFYYHVDTTCYASGFVRWWVSDTHDDTIINFDGTESTAALHPAFVEGETEHDEFYIGAYEGNVVSSKLYSTPSVQPSTNYTPTQFFTYSTARGAGYSLTTYQALCAIQLLITIEFCTLHPAWYIGEGITNLKAVHTANLSCTTGHTPGATGNVEFAPDYSEVVAYPAEVAKTRAMVYRGIENLWGNTYELLDGALIYTKKLYVRDSQNYYHGAASGDPTGTYTDTGILPATRYYDLGSVLLLPSDAGEDHIHAVSTNVAAGDVLYVYQNFYVNVGETRKVASVDTNLITFTQPLTKSWLAGTTSFLLNPQYYYLFPTMVDVGVGHPTYNWTFMPIQSPENPPQEMAYSSLNYLVQTAYRPATATQDNVWLLKHGASYCMAENESVAGSVFSLKWTAPDAAVGYTTSGRLFYRGA